MNEPTLRFVRRGVSWLNAHLDLLVPSAGDPEPAFGAFNPMAELAILSRCLLRTPAHRDDPRLEGLLRAVAEGFQQAAIHDRLFRDRDNLSQYALLLAVLREAGLIAGDDRMEALRRVLADSPLVSLADGPLQRMDLGYSLSLAGFAHDLPQPAQLIGASALGRRLNPIHLTTLDIYAITHLFLFLTDFGARPPTSLTRVQLTRARSLLDMLLGMRLHISDWDAVGELMLASHCVRSTASPIYALAQRRLLDAQGSDGLVPGRAYSRSTATDLGPVAGREYEWRECNHTTIVGVLAAALCPPAGRDP